MPNHAHEIRRSRALRAALAVTLVGLSACGSEPTDEGRDASTDAASDAAGDATADTTDASQPDAERDVVADTGLCSVVHDQTCPQSCTELDDADCCDTHCGGEGWGFLNNGECNCAVEGPFAPPSFVRQRVIARAEVA